METKAAIYYDKSGKGNFNDKITVMFNPNTYSVSRNINYGGNDGKNDKDNINMQNHANQTFSGGNNDTFSFELIYNRYNFEHYSGNEKIVSKDMNVARDINKLKALTFIAENAHTPPECKFVWSSFSFIGYISSFKADYTMFLNDGTPVRAKVQINMIGYEEFENKKIAFQSPDRTKSRILEANQQLWEIAAEEYDDAAMWREIAKANNINNPLDISNGTALIVPALKK